MAATAADRRSRSGRSGSCRRWRMQRLSARSEAGSRGIRPRSRRALNQSLQPGFDDLVPLLEQAHDDLYRAGTQIAPAHSRARLVLSRQQFA